MILSGLSYCLHNGRLSERGRDPSAVAGWRHCRWIGLSTLPGECSTCAPVPTSSSRRAQRRAADHAAGRRRRNPHTKSTLAMLHYALSRHIPALLFHARWGKLVCGSWSRWIAGRLEHSAPSLLIGPRPISGCCPARHAPRPFLARAFRMPVKVVLLPLPQSGEHSDHQSVWVVSRVDPRCSHCESLGPQWSSTSVQAPHAHTSFPPASMRFACMCAALGSTVASFLLLRPVRVVRDTCVPLARVRPLLARAC